MSEPRELSELSEPEDWLDVQARMRLMTIDEVATFLRVSRAKTYQLVSSGEVPVVRIGKSVRVRRDKLIEWLDGLSS